MGASLDGAGARLARGGRRSGRPPKKAAAPAAKAVDAPKAKDADEAVKGKGDPEASGAPRSSNVEVFKDERAETALAIFKTVPQLRDVKKSVIDSVKSMAGGGAAPDRDAIQQFVDGMAFRLVDKSNINGLISPPPELEPAKAEGKAAPRRAVRDTTLNFREASENLLDALATAKLAKNTGFLQIYNQALLATLPKLLDNNLVARVQAMIVLSQTGDPNAVPVFLKEIGNEKQTLWVKHAALHGLSTVTENGATVDSVMGVPRAVEAGKAVVDFLNAEKEHNLPWPTIVRAMEALGSLRQAAVPSAMLKADQANAAMTYLADTSAAPEVRAAAAWALGMVRVNSAIAKFNFPLVSYNAGRVAAELGDKANAVFRENPTLAERYTALLVGPIFQAFNGLEGVRESGLLHMPHPNVTASQSAIKQIADLESSVAKGAVELIRAPGGQVKKLQEDLGNRVAALKAYLDKNPPKDFHLVPNGPEFKPEGGQVANAEAPNPRVAGAAGGR